MGQVITSYDQIQRLVTGTTPAARKGIVRNEAGDGWEFAPLARTDIENTFKDSNGNELLIMSKVASAVNEITLINAATGNSPILRASGGDSDVSITLQPKGAAGGIIVCGAVGGGTPAINFYNTYGNFIAGSCTGNSMSGTSTQPVSISSYSENIRFFEYTVSNNYHVFVDNMMFKIARGQSSTGNSIKLQRDSSTTGARDVAAIDMVWNDSTDATRSGDLVFSAFYTTTGREVIRIRGGSSDGQLGFHGVTPISRAVLATGASHTVDDVITALQNLGLVKQS